MAAVRCAPLSRDSLDMPAELFAGPPVQRMLTVSKKTASQICKQHELAASQQHVML